MDRFIQNKFEIQPKLSQETQPKPKPPPINIRENSSSAMVNKIVRKKTFFLQRTLVTSLTRTESERRVLKIHEVHPIHNLQYLLHQRITLDVPHKRNCQEYGHTRTYCTLRTVCVVN
ncbi:uncharacterized protein LOC121467296 [Drosophila elegans]|uniref:uncharacterized protein LOC121467296 n=1 Tax=Drosophila elegans TaxID=30023 RepID=UPI001BC85694|nr:uncharacterized protein LOC121467296 [Drosophila elegans]